MAAQKAQDQESPLGQAYQKYMDALTLDEPKAIYNFHVGRMLVIQGSFDEAVKRLEVTLNWNPKHQFSRLELKKLKIFSLSCKSIQYKINKFSNISRFGVFMHSYDISISA